MKASDVLVLGIVIAAAMGGVFMLTRQSPAVVSQPAAPGAVAGQPVAGGGGFNLNDLTGLINAGSDLWGRIDSIF